MNAIHRIALFVFGLILLSGGQSFAQHTGPYAGVSIGGTALSGATASDEAGNFGLEFTPAPYGSASLGWDFAPGSVVGEGRIELEYSHRSNRLDTAKFVEGGVPAAGDLTADSLLVNCFGVSRDYGRYVPYLGGGVGVARIEASSLTVTGQPLGSGSSIVFAYQFGAGVEYALTDRLNLDIGYRFFGSSRPKFTEAGGKTVEMEYLSHSALIGMRFGF